MGRENRDKVWNIYKMKGSDVQLLIAKYKSSPLRDMRDKERYERGRGRERGREEQESKPKKNENS